MITQFPPKRWLKRSAKAALILVVALAVLGSSYEAISERRDRERFPQRGTSVDVGGFRLNINCTGQGSPAVIRRKETRSGVAPGSLG